jgi:catechol 2,3-dioxygenase-like lactoylglutathione lyase family enzyme
MTDVAPRLARVSLRSNDVDRAAAWHCRVFGFRETASSTARSRDSVLLRLVDGAAGCATELGLRRDDGPVGDRGAPAELGYHLAFTLEDLPASYQLAVDLGGAALTQPVGRHGWIYGVNRYPIHLVTCCSPRRAVGWRFVGLRVADKKRSVSF